MNPELQEDVIDEGRQWGTSTQTVIKAWSAPSWSGTGIINNTQLSSVLVDKDHFNDEEG